MKCEIIKDLLPVYCDGLASDETRNAVETHIAECKDCRALLSQMKEAVPEVPKPDIQPMKKIKRTLRLRLALVIGMVCLGIFVGLYNMLIANPMAISSKNISVRHFAEGIGSQYYDCQVKVKGQTRFLRGDIPPNSEVKIDKENDCVWVNGKKLAVMSVDYEPVYAPADGKLTDGGVLLVEITCDTPMKYLKRDYPPRFGEFSPAEQELTLRPCLKHKEDGEHYIEGKSFMADFPVTQCGEGATLTVHCRDKDVVIDLHKLAVEDGLLEE